MTDQKRIFKLKRWGSLEALLAADRIEELVKERDEERTKRKMAEGLAGLSSADIDGHSAMITIARDAVAKRIAAEAKLAKAVEALRVISQFNAVTNSHLNIYNIFKMTDRARTVLAELEGKE